MDSELCEQEAHSKEDTDLQPIYQEEVEKPLNQALSSMISRAETRAELMGFRAYSFKTIMQRHDDCSRVIEFITPDGSWDVFELERFFISTYVEGILSITLARGPDNDSWCWHYDKEGVYNVKSGYSLVWSLQCEEGVADVVPLVRWWNGVWNLNIPPKVLRRLSETLSREDFGRALMMFWWVCFDKNSVPFGGSLSRVVVLSELALSALSEFQDHRVKGFFQVTAVPILKSSTRWLTPVSGFALATDAAVVTGRGFVGLGGVVQDGSRTVWVAWVDGADGYFPVPVAELVAV
uniref:Uncharacterized protein n=1 Tax=Cannabis sativa TaxID=3483 RepID=A0A803QFP1_CANSA